MKPIDRYYLAAAAIDCATYMAVTGVSYRAIRLGATPLQLGLIPALFSLVYVSATLMSGRLSDRLPRIALARTGAGLLAAAVIVHWTAGGLSLLFQAMPIMALGLALFWPSLQAALAEADHPARLNANLGRFNIYWSLGKGVGFVLAGLLFVRYGFNAPFAGALGLALLVTLLLRSAPALESVAPAVGAGPRRPVPAGEEASPEPVPAPIRRAFLHRAWIANALAYGVVATLNYHYPKYLSSLGFGASLYGGFQGLVYFSVTLTFVVLRRWHNWHYRRAPLYLAQVLLAGLVLAIPLTRSPALLLLLAPGIGAVIGLAYYSSLYYSLHAAEARGRNTGLHEAVLGSGSLIIPFIGGSLAAQTGQLGAPYVVCAVLGLTGIGAEEWLARRAVARSSGGWANMGGNS